MRALRDASPGKGSHCKTMCQRRRPAAIPSVSPRPAGFPTSPKISRISAVSRALPDNPVYSRHCKIKCLPSAGMADRHTAPGTAAAPVTANGDGHCHSMTVSVNGRDRIGVNVAAMPAAAAH